MSLCFRYNVCSETIKVVLFKLFIGGMLTSFLYANAVTAIRLLQVWSLSYLHLRNSFFNSNAKFSFSLLGKFIFLSTVWLFLQVVVWKRVMEINEELASTCINRALLCMGLSLTWLCHPEPKTLAVMAVFGESHSDTPLNACKSSTDPLDQRWFWV